MNQPRADDGTFSTERLEGGERNRLSLSNAEQELVVAMRNAWIKPEELVKTFDLFWWLADEHGHLDHPLLKQFRLERFSMFTALLPSGWIIDQREFTDLLDKFDTF